jgi:hypothetical protein
MPATRRFRAGGAATIDLTALNGTGGGTQYVQITP